MDITTSIVLISGVIASAICEHWLFPLLPWMKAPEKKETASAMKVLIAAGISYLMALIGLELVAVPTAIPFEAIATAAIQTSFVAHRVLK